MSTPAEKVIQEFTRTWADLSSSVDEKAMAEALSNARATIVRLEASNRDLEAAVHTYRKSADAAERLLNSPELHSFAEGVVLEAAHQRHRWGSDHDAGKTPENWFWLIGYLAGKALRAHLTGDTAKALHHTISTAAALNNWHAQISGASNVMRPGLSEEATATTEKTQ